MNDPMKINTTQSGFTMMEILVTLLILAIGLLGIAALQFKAMRYSNDAFRRSQVTFLAYEIADRMRINKKNADDYISFRNFKLSNTLPPCREDVRTDAATDLDCWWNKAANALPPTALPPTIPSTTSIGKSGELYNVVMQWQDREGVVHRIGYSFEL